ncbi:MAG: hypothetical protein BGN92_10065 [Sphingobacteriales bacterium 41-5]|nr:MAG: hypothetical protein BGN92_10065 [Sphingobacteriales bacterium 41-5]
MNKDDLNIQIEYHFSSGLGPREEYRYIKSVTALIFNGEYADNDFNDLIGKLRFKILYINNAKNDGFDIFQLFDTYEYTFRHGESFYDFREIDFKKALYKHYDGMLFNENFCIIETMTLLPQYRGMQLGPKLFKDIVYHFSGDCTLFMLQPYPLQFEVETEECEERKKIELNSFERNKNKAFKKLTAYYESWGLQKVKGIKDLLFYNTEVQNEKFDQINLED